MNWLLRWPEIFLVVLVAALEAYRLGYTNTPGIVHATWSPQRKSEMRCVIRPCTTQLARRFLRDKVRDLWYHGYTSYMRFGAWIHKLVIFFSANTLQKLSL